MQKYVFLSISNSSVFLFFQMEMLKRSIIHFHYKVIYLKLIENDNNKQPYKQTSTQTKRRRKKLKIPSSCLSVWQFCGVGA